MDITGRRIRVEIINGPNLQRIGRREPEIYGTRSMEDWLAEQRTAFSDSLEITYFQSNHEGALIDRLYTLDDERVDAIILNAGAYSHTSLALADALRAITPPTLEVHISNIYAREEQRRHSLISEACVGVIAGFGLDSYRLALASIPTLLQQSK
jgi:dehydroquinase class II